MPLSPLTPEDREVARLIGRMVLVFYSSTAVALSAWIIAHVALRIPAARPPVEVAAKPKPPARPVSFRRGA
jgi:hypothetical protein